MSQLQTGIRLVHLTYHPAATQQLCSWCSALWWRPGPAWLPQSPSCSEIMSTVMRQHSLQTSSPPSMKPPYTNARAAASTWYGRQCGRPLRPHITWQTSHVGLTRELNLLHAGSADGGCHLSWLNQLHEIVSAKTSNKGGVALLTSGLQASGCHCRKHSQRLDIECRSLDGLQVSVVALPWPTTPHIALAETAVPKPRWLPLRLLIGWPADSRTVLPPPTTLQASPWQRRLGCGQTSQWSASSPWVQAQCLSSREKSLCQLTWIQVRHINTGEQLSRKPL